MPLLEVADGFGRLRQLETAVDHRCYLAGDQQIAQERQVLRVQIRFEGLELLAHERGQHYDLQHASQRSKQALILWTAAGDSDIDAMRQQDTLVIQQRVIADAVENQIVTLRPLREVLAGVVDDMVCAQRPDQLDVPGAANPGHVCAERLGDLHGESTNASGRAIDQDFLPWLQSAVVAQPLQRGERGNRHGRRLLKCQSGGFQRDHPVLVHRDVLSQRPTSRAEDFITRLEALDVLADRFDGACKVDSKPDIFGHTHADVRTHDEGLTAHIVPVEGIDGGRAHFDQDPVVLQRWLLDGFNLDDLRRAVTAIDSRLHRLSVGRERRRGSAGRVVA